MITRVSPRLKGRSWGGDGGGGGGGGGGRSVLCTIRIIMCMCCVYHFRASEGDTVI